MIKAVVFDMGGVIHTVRLDEERCLAFARDVRALLSRQGVHIPDAPEVFLEKLNRADEARKAYNERTLTEASPLMAWSAFYLKEYGVAPERIFPIADELCLRWSRDRIVDTPRPHLHECLGALRAMGMRMGIISNTLSRTFVPQQLCDYGVSRYFEYVLLSSVCGLRKPGTRIFDLCQHSMGLERREMAYVGDTYSRDVRGAKDAGWALMLRMTHPEAKPYILEREKQYEAQGYAPDATVSDLAEIPPVIAAYNAAHMDEEPFGFPFA